MSPRHLANNTFRRKGARRFRNPDYGGSAAGLRRSAHRVLRSAEATAGRARVRGGVALQDGGDACESRRQFAGQRKSQTRHQKKGKGRICVTPLDEQPEPPNIIALTAALVQRCPMTNLLDILKETELRVRLTECFRSVGAREGLSPDVL